MQKLKTKLQQFTNNRLIQHFLFWCLSFLVLLNILKVSAEVKQIDLIYTAVFHLPLILIVYLNLKLLFPLLENKRYLFYGLSVIALIAFGSGFYLLLFNTLIDYIFQGYYFVAFYNFWDISLYFIIYVFLTSLFRLARGWFRLQEMEKEKTLSELKALRSQINPHFLFNSLNSIYGLARKNSNLVPEKILQLSDLMRHIIYESESSFIPLEKEIEMIGNYIELQNLRTTESEKIEFFVSGNTDGKKIAPFIFIPFVENIFKHGVKGGSKNTFVKIRINVSENMVHFFAENSKGIKKDTQEKRYNGIGIENVKKRLELIYPNHHSLKIFDEQETFKVNLQVEIG